MRSFLRVAAVVAAITLPLSLATTQAGAKPKPKATPQITVTASPNPLVETLTSDVAVVIQVECNPVNCANKPITISSTQLSARCTGAAPAVTYLSFYDTAALGSPAAPLTVPGSITLVADNDGNATVVAVGSDCAPGPILITADIDAPPFSTATTKLVVEPPQVTPPGVKGFPANEVETGDGGAGMGTFGASDVGVVFQVETNPVYAEQTASITSDQLTARCGLGSLWANFTPTAPGFASITTGNGPFLTPPTGLVDVSSIDNDGNVVFLFAGASCAAGKSTVIAEIGGGGPTYSTQYNILPPAVTI